MQTTVLFGCQESLYLVDDLLYTDPGQKRDSIYYRDINIIRNLRRSDNQIGIGGKHRNLWNTALDRMDF